MLNHVKNEMKNASHVKCNIFICSLLNLKIAEIFNVKALLQKNV